MEVDKIMDGVEQNEINNLLVKLIKTSVGDTEDVRVLERKLKNNLYWQYILPKAVAIYNDFFIQNPTEQCGQNCVCDRQNIFSQNHPCLMEIANFKKQQHYNETACRNYRKQITKPHQRAIKLNDHTISVFTAKNDTIKIKCENFRTITNKIIRGLNKISLPPNCELRLDNLLLKVLHGSAPKPETNFIQPLVDNKTQNSTTLAIEFHLVVVALAVAIATILTNVIYKLVSQCKTRQAETTGHKTKHTKQDENQQTESIESNKNQQTPLKKSLFETNLK